MNRAVVVSTLKSIAPRLRDRGIAALYLFGSYARDEATKESDLDLLAEFEPGRDSTFRGFMAPFQDLEAAFPGIEIGLVTLDRLDPLYRPYVEQTAVRVF